MITLCQREEYLEISNYFSCMIVGEFSEGDAGRVLPVPTPQWVLKKYGSRQKSEAGAGSDRATKARRASSRSVEIRFAVTWHQASNHKLVEPAAYLIRHHSLDHPGLEFPGQGHDDGLGASPGFISVIGGLLPMAPCGRSSL